VLWVSRGKAALLEKQRCRSPRRPLAEIFSEWQIHEVFFTWVTAANEQRNSELWPRINFRAELWASMNIVKYESLRFYLRVMLLHTARISEARFIRKARHAPLLDGIYNNQILQRRENNSWERL
jgi:hypothetical protein